MENANPGPISRHLRLKSAVSTHLIPEGSLLAIFPTAVSQQEFRAGRWFWNLRWCKEDVGIQGMAVLPNTVELDLDGEDISQEAFGEALRRTVANFRPGGCITCSKTSPGEVKRTLAIPRPDLQARAAEMTRGSGPVPGKSGA